MGDISITGKFKDGDGKEHDIDIDVTKGEKETDKKRRKPDKIHIKVDGTDVTELIIKAKRKKKKDDTGGDEEIEIEWTAAEENSIGGWSGFSDGFGLRVHCPKDGAKDDEPYVIIELTEKAREAAKKSKAFGFPSLPEGELRVKISEKDQKKLNKYFSDPELPKHLS